MTAYRTASWRKTTRPLRPVTLVATLKYRPAMSAHGGAVMAGLVTKGMADAHLPAAAFLR